MNRPANLVIAVVISGAIGFAVSAAWMPAIAVSIIMPALWIRQRSRQFCFACALMYYLLALWSLPVVARNFFGPKAGFLEGLGLWISASGLLALPWRWIWCHSAEAALWRVPLGLLMSIVPPLGLIGWASPTVAAGLLFPAAGYIGLAITVCLPGCLAVLPKQTLVAAVVLAVVCNAVHPQPPNAPANWQGVDTHYGSVAHGRPDAGREYQISQDLQSRSLSSTARVIIFPESVVPSWTDATDLFWDQTATELKEAGKIVVIGAIARTASASAQRRALDYDFTGSIAALHNSSEVGGQQLHIASNTEQSSYNNGVVVRGAETGTFIQRVPIPFGMWRPFTDTGVPLRLANPAVIRIADHNAAIIICYEQLIPWTVLTSLLERPSIIVAIANNFWVSGTPIPDAQQSTIRAWARLFHLPVIFATNF